MTNKTYNGWTNYETWLCNLWLEEDEYRTNEWIPEQVKASENEWEYARTLRGFVEEEGNGFVPGGLTGFAADLLNSALSEINYHEITEHHWADHRKDDDEDGAL